MNKPEDVDRAPVHAVVMPRIYGPIADSWVIERGESPRVEWLTPEREWQGSLFEAARFELDDRENAEWWLQREIDAIAVCGDVATIVEKQPKRTSA